MWRPSNVPGVLYLWNVLIIGTLNFNYLIRSNSWNEWSFEIYNRSNGQVLLSFIFSCYNILLILPTSSHGALHSMESSVCLEWVESVVAFCIHSSSVSQSKQLSSLDRWPTVKLLLSTLHITWPRWICRLTRAMVHSWRQSLRLQQRCSPLGVSTT